LAVVCSAFLIGCKRGSPTPAATAQEDSGAATNGAEGQDPRFYSLDRVPPEERPQAVRDIGKMPPGFVKNMRPVLEKFAKDPDPQVAAAAKEVLDQSAAPEK